MLAFTPALVRAGAFAARRRRVLTLFAAAVTFQLLVSGLYHCMPFDTGVRAVFQRADHVAIWLTVVGCFLPVRELIMKTRFGAGLEVAVVLLAFVGLLLETAFHALIPSWVIVLTYVVFGSIGTPVAIWLVATRGLRYTLPFFLCGIAFSTAALVELTSDLTLVPGVVGYHEVVHVLVLIGFALHWRFVLKLTREAAPASAPEPEAASVPELASVESASS